MKMETKEVRARLFAFSLNRQASIHPIAFHEAVDSQLHARVVDCSLRENEVR